MSRRPSYRKILEAMCRQCIFDAKAPGSWRAQVGACTDTKCPAYPVRPRAVEKTAFTAPKPTLQERAPQRKRAALS